MGGAGVRGFVPMRWMAHRDPKGKGGVGATEELWAPTFGMSGTVILSTSFLLDSRERNAAEGRRQLPVAFQEECV